MAGFGEPGDAFGTEADCNDLGRLALEVEGGLEIGDVVAGVGDGVTEKDDTVGGEKGVGGLGDAPDFFENGNEFGIVFNQLGPAVGVEVVFVEVGFGGFGEVLHLVGHGVGFSFVDAVGLLGIAGTLDEAGVGAGFFGGLEGGENFRMVVTEEVVVVGVCQFVEDEVGHAPGLGFEIMDAGEFDRFGHFDRFVVVHEPGGAGVVAGAALAIGRGGEIEGDFFEVSDGGGGNAVDDGLKLLIEKLEGAFGFFACKVLVKEDGPTEVVLDRVVGGWGKVGMTGDAEVGGEDVAELNEGALLGGGEGGEEVGRGDGLVGFEGKLGFEAELEGGVVWFASLEEGDGGFTFRFWSYFFFSF